MEQHYAKHALRLISAKNAVLLTQAFAYNAEASFTLATITVMLVHRTVLLALLKHNANQLYSPLVTRCLQLMDILV